MEKIIVLLLGALLLILLGCSEGCSGDKTGQDSYELIPSDIELYKYQNQVVVRH